MNSTEGAPSSGAGLRRVAIASCVGTTIEFYGFFIYGTAATLVFPKVFFPALGSTSARWPRSPRSRWRSSPTRSGRWASGTTAPDRPQANPHLDAAADGFRYRADRVSAGRGHDRDR